jgi:branched-chain amino acid transport system permease protein
VPSGGTRLSLGWIGGLAVLYAALIVLPHLLSFSQKEIAVFLLINTLLVASYRVLTLTGEWSLGHVVIMGVGGYASALFAKLIGLPVPLAMLAGAATAALVAYVLSFPLLRMKGFYFLIGSFAAGEVIRLIWKKFRVPFGGPKGLKLIPGFPDIELGGLKIAFFDPVNYYYLSLIVVSLSLLVLYRLERSRFGLTFHAVHWQDKLAESVGVDTRRYRTLAFVVASFFAGLSGALLAHYIGTVNPNRFDVEEMVFVLIWVIVGGTATFYGPILGVVVLTVINELILRQLGVDAARPLIYGGILIVTMLFLPNGLESLASKIKGLFAGKPGGGPEGEKAAAE